jgi:hypothetical protein
MENVFREGPFPLQSKIPERILTPLKIPPGKFPKNVSTSKIKSPKRE